MLDQRVAPDTSPERAHAFTPIPAYNRKQWRANATDTRLLRRDGSPISANCGWPKAFAVGPFGMSTAHLHAPAGANWENGSALILNPGADPPPPAPLR